MHLNIMYIYIDSHTYIYVYISNILSPIWKRIHKGFTRHPTPPHAKASADGAGMGMGSVGEIPYGYVPILDMGYRISIPININIDINGHIDIKIHIDINMYIDIRIVMNRNAGHTSVSLVAHSPKASNETRHHIFQKCPFLKNVNVFFV